MLEINQIQFTPQLEAFRARLALLRGEVGIAVHWLQTGVKPARMSLWFWEANDITHVKALIAQGTAVSYQKADDLLTACQQYAEETASVWLLIQIWALRALLAQAQDQSEKALTAAEEAVRLAEPGGYLRLFVELGTEMADLLAQVASVAFPLPTSAVFWMFFAPTNCRKKMSDRARIGNFNPFAARFVRQRNCRTAVPLCADGEET